MKTIRYECEVWRVVEYLEYCEKEKAYIYVDPYKTEDHGIVDTRSEHSLPELMKTIERHYGKLENIGTELVPEYRYCDDFEYHHSVPVEERLPAINEYYFHFYKVTSESIDLNGNEILTEEDT